MGYPYQPSEVLQASDMNAVGLHLITPSSVTGGTLSGATVTIGSAVSTITVNGVFSADFQNYKIVIDILDSSADTSLDFKIGSAAAGYFGGHFGYRFNGSTFSNFSNNVASTTIGALGAGWGGLHVIDISKPFQTEETSWSGNFVYRRTSAGNGGFGYTGGMTTNTLSHTYFTLTNGGYTMTGGTIRVYGYSNGG